MNPVQRSEILSLGDYEAIRDRFRARVLEEKRHRRAALGDIMSVIFENHDTVLMQIQEMLRTERISSEPGIAHELETYNELVPGDDELSFTLFVEIEEKARRDEMLVALAGMESKLYLEVDGERLPTQASARDGADPERTTAVQYHKIPLPEAVAKRLRAGEAEAVTLGIEHPAYSQRVELAADVVAQLKADLSWSS